MNLFDYFSYFFSRITNKFTKINLLSQHCAKDLGCFQSIILFLNLQIVLVAKCIKYTRLSRSLSTYLILL